MAEPLADRAPSLLHPRTSLVGRAAEIAAARALLLDEAVPLLTLTGPGGVGKTRLALALAREAVDAFADGAVFVDLAPVRDPALVPSAIAQVLGVRESDVGATTDQLRSFLWPRQVLLLLDNCEQVLQAAPQLAELLLSCPALQIVATSRAPLRIRGEHLLPVPPLPLPDDSERSNPQALAAVDAVALFVQRARAADPGFALDAATGPVVADICARLDGLPLAIELAAARLRILSPPALLALLTDRLRVLVGGERDLPARLRTMRDAIAWSHELLAPSDQQLFRRLGVFVGGFDLDAAAAVAGDGPSDLIDRLEALADQSLLRREEQFEVARFSMLETVREFALDGLTESGEEAATRDAHAAHFLALAERVGTVLTRRIVTALLDRLEPERANLRAALAWLAERGNDEAVLRLAGGVWALWEARGPVGEFRGWLERAADPAVAVGERVRGWALWQAANLALRQGDHPRAAILADLALAVFREIGDDPAGLGASLVVRGLAANRQGDHSVAVAACEEAVAIFRHHGPDRSIGAALVNLGGVTMEAGDLVGAAPLLEEALAVARKVGDPWDVALALLMLAECASRQGEYTRALIRFRDAAGTDAAGDRNLLAAILQGIGILAARHGRFAAAARLFGAESGTRGPDRPPLLSTMAAEAAQWGEAARAGLGRAAFAAEWEAGVALAPGEAIALARAVAGDLVETAAVADRPSVPPLSPIGKPPSARTSDAFGLSRREREVLALLAQRQTAAEIADALCISDRTVERHISNIYDKLGVGSRREATAVAVHHGLA